jgi:RNase P subunit RPR2
MNVQFLCPKKNELIVTDLRATSEVLQENWSKVISCHCPHCGAIHSFSVREAYIDGVLRVTTQDQRDLDNPLVRFAHAERRRREAAAPVGPQRRTIGSRS